MPWPTIATKPSTAGIPMPMEWASNRLWHRRSNGGKLIPICTQIGRPLAANASHTGVKVGCDSMKSPAVP